MADPHQADRPPLYEKLLASEEEVRYGIDVLASRLIDDFRDAPPLFVCLLRGGVHFSAGLMSAITRIEPYFHPELDYMTVGRYGDEREGKTPHLAMDLSPRTAIIDRKVIILDDLIDHGDTYDFSKRHLENKGAAGVQLAALVQRVRSDREVDADYHCFTADTEAWLTGMGLDDARIAPEANRWAGYIAIANP